MGELARKIGRAFADRKHRTVHVPEWDLTIYVFPLTLGQLSRIREELDPERQMARILMVRARNEKGEPLFDKEDEDAFFDQGVDAFGPDVVKRVVAQLGWSDTHIDEAADEKN